MPVRRLSKALRCSSGESRFSSDTAASNNVPPFVVGWMFWLWTSPPKTHQQLQPSSHQFTNGYAM